MSDIYIYIYILYESVKIVFNIVVVQQLNGSLGVI